MGLPDKYYTAQEGQETCSLSSALEFSDLHHTEIFVEAFKYKRTGDQHSTSICMHNRSID